MFLEEKSNEMNLGGSVVNPIKLVIKYSSTSGLYNIYNRVTKGEVKEIESFSVLPISIRFQYRKQTDTGVYTTPLLENEKTSSDLFFYPNTGDKELIKTGFVYQNDRNLSEIKRIGLKKVFKMYALMFNDKSAALCEIEISAYLKLVFMEFSKQENPFSKEPFGVWFRVAPTGEEFIIGNETIISGETNNKINGKPIILPNMNYFRPNELELNVMNSNTEPCLNAIKYVEYKTLTENIEE